MNLPQIPGAIASVFDATPVLAMHRLLEMRVLIFDAATSTETGPLFETLKWGQPSYLTQASKAGTTIRLGWSSKEPDHCGLYVYCSTDLVDRYREAFPTEFLYRGSRAVLVPIDGEFPTEPFRRIAGMALTYHRDKRERAKVSESRS